MSYSYNTRLLSYSECAGLLQGRNRESRKVANNTYLHRGYNSDAYFAVVLHGTTVVRVNADGTYTLNSGGYRTVTTKERINCFSPACLFQKDWAWYVRCDPTRWQDRVPFRDGMRVNSDGTVRF